MNDSQKLEAILTSVKNIEALLAVPAPASAASPAVFTAGNKGLSLTGLARRSQLKNGQQRIAAIVGYYEKLQSKDDVTLEDIQTGWKAGKFAGDYASVYLHRALKEDFIREKQKGVFDLSQPGEDFFTSVLNDSQ